MRNNLEIEEPNSWKWLFKPAEYTLSDVVANKLSLLKDGVIVKEVDLTSYIDDTNLARLVSGTVDANGIATFKRDDDSTFTVDFRSLINSQVQSDWSQVDSRQSSFIKNKPSIQTHIIKQNNGFRLKGDIQGGYIEPGEGSLELYITDFFGGTSGNSGKRSVLLAVDHGDIDGEGAFRPVSLNTGDYSLIIGSAINNKGRNSFLAGGDLKNDSVGSNLLGNNNEDSSSSFGNNLFGTLNRNLKGRNTNLFGNSLISNQGQQSIIGQYNENLPEDLLDKTTLILGGGVTNSQRKDVLRFKESGKLIAPNTNILNITEPKSLITKEYADTNYVSNIGLITEGKGSFTPTISPINGVDYSGNITGDYNYVGNRVDFVVKLEKIKGGLDSSTQDVVINIPIGVSEPINGKYIGDVEKSKVIIEEFSGWNVNFFSVNPYMTSVGGLVTFLRLKTSSNSSLYDTNLKGVSVTNAKMVLKGSFYLSENIF